MPRASSSTTDPAAGPARDADAGCALLARHRDVLDTLEPPVTEVALLLRDDVVETANAFADRLPHAHVQVLGARRALTSEETSRLHARVDYVLATSERARLELLWARPRPQLILDVGNKKRAHKLSSFRHFLYLVAPDGVYIVDELDACGDPRYDDADGTSVLGLLTEVAAAKAMFPKARSEASKAARELAVAVRRIDFDGRRAVVHRSGRTFYTKLRDWEADDVLTARHGSQWGEVLETRPAKTFVSQALLTSYGDGPIQSGAREFSVPERYLRLYHDVDVTARQVVRYGDYVLPDTWRHPHQRLLNNRQLAQSSPYFGRYLDRTEPTSRQRLAGSFYYLDTELPGHFGHVVTDVVSRVWGWSRAHELDPGLRPLVSVSREPKGIPRFQQQIFESLGIPTDDLLVVGPLEEYRLERLIGATPQLENPTYIDPDLAEVWRRLGERLAGTTPVVAEKIFVSRRPSDKRHCVNTDQVEQFFADRGFAVVFPEDYPYPDQIALFRQARIIAGFGGSGMFTMMVNPNAVIVLVSGNSYNAQNEHLIAAANGNEIHYFWGESEIAMPKGRFSLEAFTSSFTVDLRRFRRALDKVIG